MIKTTDTGEKAVPKMREEFSKRLICTSTSMNPTLKVSDMLQITPYSDSRKVQCGDVVAFYLPPKKCIVIHRVISVKDREIKTRGDNNKSPDSWIVNPEDIVGRVIYAQRGNRLVHIYSGLLGHMWTVLIRLSHLLRMMTFFPLRPFYYWLSNIGYLKRLWSYFNKIEIISFNRPNGIELQLFTGGRKIGRLPPRRAKWLIRRPFRLFIDEISLPKSRADYAHIHE